MTEYEARLVMGLGLANEIIAIECLDDEAAVQAAELLEDEYDVELWRGAVRLGTLHHYMRSKDTDENSTSNVVPFPRRQTPRQPDKSKIARMLAPHTPLSADEFSALKQLSKSFARGTIVEPVSSRLVKLGYANKFLSNLIITDEGLARLAVGNGNGEF